MKGIREQQKEERRDVILQAARTLVIENGYEAMTMDALAERARVTKPTLYAYFPNKELVAVASVVQLVQRGVTHLETMDDSLPALTRLESIYNWAMVNKYVHRYIAFAGGASQIVRAHSDYQEAHARLMEGLSSIIDQGKQSGEINPDLETSVAIRLFVSVMRDQEYDELVEKGIISAELLVQTLVRMLISALKK